MQVFWTMLVGFAVGCVAGLVTRRVARGALFLAVVLGMTGASLADSVGRVLRLYRPGEVAGFVIAVAGAALLVIPYLVLRTRR